MKGTDIKIKLINLSIIFLLPVLLSGCGASYENSHSPVSLQDIKDDVDLSQDKSVTLSDGELYLEDRDLLSEKEKNLEEINTNDAYKKLDEKKEDGLISIKISAAGDVTLGTTQIQDYSYSFDSEYNNQDDKSYFFKNVLPIFANDDLTYVNLEGPLTNSTDIKTDQTYCIKGKPEYVRLLELGGIEACGFANNHRLDYGTSGSDETYKLLKDAGIACAYDTNVDMVTINKCGVNIKVGLISVNEVNYGSLVEKLVEEGISKLKDEKANIILVMCHWGAEKETVPENYQTVLGRKCIDMGADLVIGSHPHVLQGIDCYKGKYILYSLGNFCFGANRNPSDKDTMIVQETFYFDSSVSLTNSDLQIFPCSVSSTSERNNFQPTTLSGSEAERVIEKINSLSKDYNVSFDKQGYVIDD